jgi:hypothetical protein
MKKRQNKIKRAILFFLHCPFKNTLLQEVGPEGCDVKESNKKAVV